MILKSNAIFRLRCGNAKGIFDPYIHVGCKEK
jgi:hypothetical protein